MASSTIPGGLPAAPEAASGAAGALSASAQQQLRAIGAKDKRAEVEPDPAEFAKSSRPAAVEQSGLATLVVAATGATARHSGLVALVRVDAGHIKGDLELEDHIAAFQAAVESTQELLIQKKLGVPVSAAFTLVNGRLGPATCIMAHMKCAVTAEAMVARFGSGGFAVDEDGVLVAYKATDGLTWYKEKDAMELADKPVGEQICVVYRGLPAPRDVVDFYKQHGETHYGSIARDPIVNVHEFGGIKTLKPDGSITYVFNNEKGVKSVAKTPLMLNEQVKLGELCLSRRGIEVLNAKCCRDDACRGFNGFHELSCKENEVKDQMRKNKNVAITKSFKGLMQENSQQVLGVRSMLKDKYGPAFCHKFSKAGIPCIEGKCNMKPCAEWDTLVASELSSTIYAKMPDSVRGGSRGRRGGGSKRFNGRGGKGKENETDNDDDF